jgi:hypothetical protein
MASDPECLFIDTSTADGKATGLVFIGYRVVLLSTARERESAVGICPEAEGAGEAIVRKAGEIAMKAETFNSIGRTDMIQRVDKACTMDCDGPSALMIVASTDDTDPAIKALLIEGYRRMSPAQKLERMTGGGDAHRGAEHHQLNDGVDHWVLCRFAFGRARTEYAHPPLSRHRRRGGRCGPWASA